MSLPAGPAPLRPAGHVELPEHRGPGGFDHADVDAGGVRLYLAHTANDELDVVDLAAGRLVRSIPGLPEVAGVLVSGRDPWVFTSNRGEDTVGILRPGGSGEVAKVGVGARPNGLAFDPDRGTLLSANVGRPSDGDPPSVTLVDVAARRAVVTLPMPGRTRWAVFDPGARVFLVNVSDPPGIAVIEPHGSVARFRTVPARGPHGLALDAERRRLYCACDDGRLVALDADSDGVAFLDLSGPPDVVFLDPAWSRLYVAVGNPGVVDVVDVTAWERIGAVPTGPGAHTLALDASTHRVYAFLPATHRAVVLEPVPTEPEAAMPPSRRSAPPRPGPGGTMGSA